MKWGHLVKKRQHEVSKPLRERWVAGMVSHLLSMLHTLACNARLHKRMRTVCLLRKDKASEKRLRYSLSRVWRTSSQRTDPS